MAHRQTTIPAALRMYAEFPSNDVAEGLLFAAEEREEFARNRKVRKIIKKQVSGPRAAELFFNVPLPIDIAWAFDLFAKLDPARLYQRLADPVFTPELMAFLGQERLVTLLKSGNRQARVKAIAAMAYLGQDLPGQQRQAPGRI